MHSLRAETYPNVEVLVVDNASPNGDVRALRRWEGQADLDVRVIACPANLGFAGGNNRALPYANGLYLLYLNNDTEVPAGLIAHLVEAMERRPEIGLASPKIHFAEAPGTFQYAGCGPIRPLTVRGDMRGHGEADHGQYDEAGPTYFAHGAAMIARRSVVDAVGPMAEGFFLYYEELDWAERIRRAGFEVWYLAGPAVQHKESRSVGPSSPLKTYYQTRNRLLFLRRNRTGWVRAAAMLYVAAVAGPAGLLRHVLATRTDLAAAHARGTIAGLTLNTLV